MAVAVYEQRPLHLSLMLDQPLGNQLLMYEPALIVWPLCPMYSPVLSFLQ